MKDAIIFLKNGESDGIIPYSIINEASIKFGLTHRDLEKICLENHLIPSRYHRNRNTFSHEDQLILFNSKVAIAGCGGLGQYAIEELARLGVGQIKVVDPDVLEDHNLNRQIFSSPKNLGQSKVKAAYDRITEINPAVNLIPVMDKLTLENGYEILKESDVVIDALDNIPSRLDLSVLCENLNIPLIHGAIAGWYGHVSTLFPGDGTIRKIYENKKANFGIEKNVGNPSFAPALIATLQVAEACKVILGAGQPLKHRKIVIDLLEMEFHEILI